MPRSSTTWTPGRSGNPGGRPKVITEVRDVARAYTEEAIMTLVAIMQDEGAPPAARIVAAEAILNRAWGKPRQDVAAVVSKWGRTPLSEAFDQREAMYGSQQHLIAAE